MKIVLAVEAALAAGLIGTSALAEAATEPPMNNFDFAFYTCDNGAAFQISYDSDKPTTATMTTTNNNGAPYVLTRTPSKDGAQFSNGAVKFWTDEKSVVVEGTQTQFANCKLKANGT